MIKKKKNKKPKRKIKNSFHGSHKDNYTIVCHYNEAICYTPFYGTGEQLKQFALKKKKEKYEGKLPKRVSIELIG